MPNTVFVGVYSNSEIVNLSVLLPTVVKNDVFLKVFKGLSTLEAYITETV